MGIGGGGGIGGGPVPREGGLERYDTEPETIIKHQEIGLIPPGSSEIIPMTQQFPTGMRGNQSEPGRPTLESPVHTMRSEARADLGEGEIRWDSFYEKLLNSLPEDLRGLLKEEMTKPFNERNGSFVAFNNVLEGFAKASVWLEGILQPTAATPSEELAYLRASALPAVALNSAMNQLEAVLDAADGYLNTLGPNTPGYDDLVGLLNDLNESMQLAREQAKELHNADKKKQGQAEMTRTATELNEILENFSFDKVGGQLRIIGPYISGMSTAAAGQGVGKASASLFLAVVTSLGSYQSSSTTPTLDKLIGSLSDNLLSSETVGTKAEVKELNGALTDLLAYQGEGG